MRASFLLWLFLLLLFITGCSRSVYIAPIIIEDLSAQGIAGQTRCSVNNLPVSHIDPVAWTSVNREFIIDHEQTHAVDMYRYKGGCWAFIYRYGEDKDFAMKAEYRAYCQEGQLALRRNVNPRAIWDRIENALSRMDSVRVKRFKNCIY